LIQIKLTDSTQKESLREYHFGSTLPLISGTSSSFSSSYGSSAGQQAFIHFSKCIEACVQGIVRDAAL
ncbi:unnamed protein product, partial [Adineta steineri]